MSESFLIRDDEAVCEDCDWTWKQAPVHKPFDIAGGGRAAKKHAAENGHTTTVRRVQFTRHWGLRL